MCYLILCVWYTNIHIFLVLFNRVALVRQTHAIQISGLSLYRMSRHRNASGWAVCVWLLVHLERFIRRHVSKVYTHMYVCGKRRRHGRWRWSPSGSNEINNTMQQLAECVFACPCTVSTRLGNVAVVFLFVIWFRMSFIYNCCQTPTLSEPSNDSDHPEWKTMYNIELPIAVVTHAIVCSIIVNCVYSRPCRATPNTPKYNYISLINGSFDGWTRMPKRVRNAQKGFRSVGRMRFSTPLFAPSAT